MLLIILKYFPNISFLEEQLKGQLIEKEEKNTSKWKKKGKK